jgi:hypothetical protein
VSGYSPAARPPGATKLIRAIVEQFCYPLEERIELFRWYLVYKSMSLLPLLEGDIASGWEIELVILQNRIADGDALVANVCARVVAG